MSKVRRRAETLSPSSSSHQHPPHILTTPQRSETETGINTLACEMESEFFDFDLTPSTLNNFRTTVMQLLLANVNLTSNSACFVSNVRISVLESPKTRTKPEIYFHQNRPENSLETSFPPYFNRSWWCSLADNSQPWGCLPVINYGSNFALSFSLSLFLSLSCFFAVLVKN